MVATDRTMSSMDTLAGESEAASGRPAAQNGNEEDKAPSGPVPFLVTGAALVAGVVLAKWIDRSGRANRS
jgi:hypothetical protein